LRRSYALSLPQDQEGAAMTKRAADGEKRGAPAEEPDTPERGFTEAEVHDIGERANPRSPVVYEVLRREGESEMDRPITSLWWSGVAAGLSIAFSLIAEGMLQTCLPDAAWRPLVTRLGYTVGFLIVVLGRQQLFTENTITAVLPLAKNFSVAGVGRIGRLWVVVLLANLAGTLLAAAFCRWTPAIPAPIAKAMLDIAHESLLNDPLLMFWRAIPAGFLIAAMVWLLPTASAAQFHVIALMTYLIAVGGFKHVIAGSFETFLLLTNGSISIPTLLVGFLAPVLLGNIVGGTGLFALISYGQVAKEI
jgi:formate/nitrite transporter FocA (FNT family)